MKRPVESAAEADHFLVTGRTGDGLTQVLVPATPPASSIEPMRRVDLTRRFSAVRFDDVRVPADARRRRGRRRRRRRSSASSSSRSSCSTPSRSARCRRAFDMTVEWAFDRYSFGRPLASYQALKHRFADMKSWLEASHADQRRGGGRGGQPSAPDAAELVSAAKAYIGQYGAELVQDCVQLHGGIGVTFEHDLHLFLRRVTVDRALYGTPADHRQRIAADRSRKAQHA